jgi:hypothetical protein
LPLLPLDLDDKPKWELHRAIAAGTLHWQWWRNGHDRAALLQRGGDSAAAAAIPDAPAVPQHAAGSERVRRRAKQRGDV